MNNNQEHQVVERKGWVPSFCDRTFFGICTVHADLKENNLNRYCINCDESLCRHCLEADSHGEHKLLQIYRHVYQDAVRVADMQPHMDCSKIQAYRNNGKLVIVLQPLPHKGACEANMKQACHVCKRKLHEYEVYDFCSNACRVKVSFRKHSRKGTHHQSPLN